jgi:rhodanese-related sulfurtransferase
MESISVSELDACTKEGSNLTLVDVRESWEFDLCHIKGSINIPLPEIHNRLTELDPGKDIVVICHHGARSLQAAWFLRDSGLKNNIMNLEGGIDAWADQVEPQMPRY